MGVLICSVWQRNADETRAGAGKSGEKNHQEGSCRVELKIENGGWGGNLPVGLEAA